MHAAADGDYFVSFSETWGPVGKVIGEKIKRWKLTFMFNLHLLLQDTKCT